MITQTNNKIQITLTLPDEIKKLIDEASEVIGQETENVLLQDTQTFLTELSKLFSQFIDINTEEEK